MSVRIITLAIRNEQDTVTARQRARDIAEGLGFQPQDRTRIATAVSEIARNAFRYAGEGRVEFALEGQSVPQLLIITVSDRGPGISDLREVMEGRYVSETGMGMGIIGARRLMDQFEIQSEPGMGTVVVLKKMLPRGKPLVRADAILKLVDRLNKNLPANSLTELESQNRELMRTLHELRLRQEDLVRVNGELEDTNRGVLALYAELDERADHLRRADTLKSSFLSNMSHEFRSPLNSIQALSALLLDQIDGPLTAEQRKQVGYIKRASEDLSELVNDLLDLAKVEAGKVVVKPADFEVASLFGALRGMLRPLLVTSSVQLIFDDAADLPLVHSDEGKVSQVLRNFISNALKFTERGEIRVTARRDGPCVEFAVADTGIGIALADQSRIFEEFTQVDHPIQGKVRGTGLGLPLSRRLAHLLGGEIFLESEPGRGSTFTLRLPALLQLEDEPGDILIDQRKEGLPVLVVENRADTALLYSKWLEPTRFRMTHAATKREALRRISAERPVAILLDILLDGEDSWDLLAGLKDSEETRQIPIIICSTVDDPRKAMHLGADAYLVKPIEPETLISTLVRLTSPVEMRRVLIIDDDETDRYLLKRRLAGPNIQILEASSGAEGLSRAASLRPDLIFLDLRMPEMSGFDVLEALKSDTKTSSIPVVVHTSAQLSEDEMVRLKASAAILPKNMKNNSGSLVEELGEVGRILSPKFDFGSDGSAPAG